MNIPTTEATNPRRFFLFLVAFRWASLLPGAWLLFSTRSDELQTPLGLLLGSAVAHTLLLTIFHRPLNLWLNRRPLLLGVDLVFVGGLLAVSGGPISPFYLYALSPLLAGAFFFQLRGALSAALFFTPLYLIALLASGRSAEELDSTLLFTQFAGIWLIPLLVTYPSVLINRLKIAQVAIERTGAELTRQNEVLARSHRQLEIIHDLTNLLQAAPDVQSVQTRVLSAVTRELGFPSAAVGLVDPGGTVLKNWQHAPQKNGGLSPALPLDTSSGPLIEDLFNRRAGRYVNGRSLSTDDAFNDWLGQGTWWSFPLNLREHLVGVLLVKSPEEIGSMSQDQFDVLEVVSSQAAVSLGTTMLCIDRAQRLAVEQERNRIARDIHDTVAQSLFGIVFTLDACITMLPGNAGTVQKELLELRDLASRVREEVRSSIFDLWPAELDLTRFEEDLRSYVTQCCRPETFHIDFSIEGEFDNLSPAIRRNLYRIAQEALTNSARYSGMDSAWVSLQITSDQVKMQVKDHGRGFDPEKVLARRFNRERFGLHGMKERVEAMAGTFDILSGADKGTQLMINVPLQIPVRLHDG